MPIYEYECPKDGVFEVWQGIHEAPYVKCACGRPLKKLISRPAGIIADAEKLWDALPPRGPGDDMRREAKTDLPRNRAKLIGIPREERKKYERLYY